MDKKIREDGEFLLKDLMKDVGEAHGRLSYYKTRVDEADFGCPWLRNRLVVALSDLARSKRRIGEAFYALHKEERWMRLMNYTITKIIKGVRSGDREQASAGIAELYSSIPLSAAFAIYDSIDREGVSDLSDDGVFDRVSGAIMKELML